MAAGVQQDTSSSFLADDAQKHHRVLKLFHGALCLVQFQLLGVQCQLQVFDLLLGLGQPRLYLVILPRQLTEFVLDSHGLGLSRRDSGVNRQALGRVSCSRSLHCRFRPASNVLVCNRPVER